MQGLYVAEVLPLTEREELSGSFARVLREQAPAV